MTIPYPDRPWLDGQEFIYNTSGGESLVGTYYSATNSWTFSTQEVGANGDSILTTDVYTTNIAGDVAVGRVHFNQLQTVSTELVTQQDINWYLNDEIEKLKALLNGTL